MATRSRDGAKRRATAVIDQGDFFTEPVYGNGCSFDVKGTFSGTVTLERAQSEDFAADGVPVGTTTTEASLEADENGNHFWRAGIKGGDYTSGSAKVYLSVGPPRA